MKGLNIFYPIIMGAMVLAAVYFIGSGITGYVTSSFKDTLGGLLLGALVNGSVLGGAFLVNRVLYGLSINFFVTMALLYGIVMIFSSISYHYFRSLLQEIAFTGLFAAFIFTVVGIMMLY